MHRLMSRRKSDIFLRICFIVTIYIGWHLLLPIMIIYMPINFTHEGIAYPDLGRKGYVQREYDVSFSADGRFVAFASNGNSLRHYISDSNKGLFLYDAQSAKTRQISTGLWHPATSIERPQITSDGSHILFFAANVGNLNISYPPDQLYLYNLQTQETREIVLPEEVHVSISRDFQISPEGRYIGGVVSQGVMFIYDQTANVYRTFASEQLHASVHDYTIQDFSFLPNQEILFSAKDEASNLYGIYAIESGSYGIIDQSTYEKLLGSGRESIPEDISILTRKRFNRFYGISSDRNTAVLMLAENHEEAGDYNLTYDLYQLDRQTGTLSRIPTPNWKLPAFIILTAVNTVLAGYILFTGPNGKRPFPIL